MGFSCPKIARYAVMDSRTVRKYLNMTEDEYEDFLIKTQYRHKILNPYEDFVREKLAKFPETSSAQIFIQLFTSLSFIISGFKRFLIKNADRTKKFGLQFSGLPPGGNPENCKIMHHYFPKTLHHYFPVLVHCYFPVTFILFIIFFSYLIQNKFCCFFHFWNIYWCHTSFKQTF